MFSTLKLWRPRQRYCIVGPPMSYLLVRRMILCEVIDPRAYQISQIRCLLSALISLLRGQDLQSKALSYGSHNELLELVDRLVLTKTIFPLLLSLQRYQGFLSICAYICSKLVESNVGGVSVDTLVQLEGVLENALSLTRARKVR